MLPTVVPVLRSSCVFRWPMPAGDSSFHLEFLEIWTAAAFPAPKYGGSLP